MRKSLFSMLLGASLVVPAAFAAANPIGIWKTESTENGDYLHIKFEECGDNLCGKIHKAFNVKGEEGTEYEHLGRQMVWDMAPKSDSSWGDGKIWAPDQDKTFVARMEMAKGGLKVSGCFLLFCRDQIWTPVK